MLDRKSALLALPASFGRRLRNSQFARGVVAIAGGTAIAQALNVLAAPILTRLYTPEQMGLWGLFVSFIGVASVACTLRYEVAIVPARTDDHAAALTRICLVLTIFCAILSALVLELFRRFDVFNYGTLPSWSFWVVTPALIGVAWGMVFRFYAVRRAAFRLIGRCTILQGLARPLIQVLLAHFGTLGLLAAEAAGRWFGLGAYRSILPKPQRTLSRARLLVEYKVYPLVQLPSSLLNAVALMAPVPLFATLYGTEIGGQLALAQRAVALPLALVGTAIADVFYGRAAELIRSEPHSLRPYLLSTMGRLLGLVLPLGLVLHFFGPPLAALVFGEEWRPAGEAMAVMAPWMVAQFTIGSVSRVVFLSNWSPLKLIYDALALAIIAGLYFASPSEWHSAIAFLSWSATALYVLYGTVLCFIVSAEKLPCRHNCNERC